MAAYPATICHKLQRCYACLVTGISGSFTASASLGEGFLARVLPGIENWLDSERDQLPLWVPVGVGMGIAAWQITGASGGVALGLVCLALLLIGFASGGDGRLRHVLIVGAAALAIGFGAIAAKSALVAEPVLGKPWVGTFYGRIEKVDILSARDVVRLQLATDGHQDLPAKVRVNVATEQYDQRFKAGAVVKLRARLMPPAGPALPGGYDFARRAWFQQIGATGSALGEIELQAPAVQTPIFSAGRAKLTQHVLNQMPGASGTIGAALVTGDQGHISEQDAQAMRDSGMAHLLSISGLHVTAVVGFIFLTFSRTLSLFSWLALRVPVPLIAASAAAIAALGYTLLTGAEVPTVRSCIAALLILAALALGRDALTLRLVAFGALVVLLFWPEAMAGPSFQLSFAAVATIVILHDLPVVKRWTERREVSVGWRIFRATISLILTGVAIELILAPIALYHFHKTGLYGALANVVAIPLTTFFIMPMEALALLMDVAGLGGPFWWLAGQGISIILEIAYLVSSLPGSVTMRPAMPDWSFACIIFGALTFGLLKSKARYLGIAPFAIGLWVMITAPRPDLLVTGDGKHLALVDQHGEVSLLPANAGDYIRDMLLENAGTNANPLPIENWPGVECSTDICVFDIASGQRNWSVLATRTPYQVASMEMAAACGRVDIVISDRWLPSSCRPRWVKADRKMLETSGGLAFYLADNRVITVNDGNAHMPWMQAAREAQARTDITQ
jgi:competence protein ComEC